MSLNLVLVHPLIPQNTGSIGRMSAAAGVRLHLVQPLGFELSDRYLKRAGLDYWSEIKLHLHPSWEEFLKTECPARHQLWFLTTKATAAYHQVTFQANDYLLFGNESTGLPKHFYSEYQDRLITIPMVNPRIRSLNLSCAAAIVVYEAKRQIQLFGK